MATPHELKHRETPPTPLLLFECRLRNGSVERWSTHCATVGGVTYEPRVLRHNTFEMRLGSEDGADATGRFAAILSNVDGYCSQIERNTGWKGTRLTVRQVFYDLKAGAAETEPVTVFLGTANPPEELGEREARLSFISRLSLQRSVLPNVRVQPRCPWLFPATADQRQEAAGSDAYSRFFHCGYSSDQEDGCGNPDAGGPFTSCGYTKADCVARGMYSIDGSQRTTARFGGFQFLPPSLLVRTYGDKQWHVSEGIDNRARSNDVVPLVYGTVWYQPPVVFTRNDGNLTHCEVLLGMGPMEAVHKVIVNSVEIPLGQAGADMTATGWYNVVSLGTRNGAFNPDFTDGSGAPQGDPHGGMAVLSVVVPNRLNDGTTLPRVEVLADGLRLARYDTQGARLDDGFTKNPAWVLLDVVRRSGWQEDEINLASFATTAAYCDELLTVKDALGNDRTVSRFGVNLLLGRRRSTADIVRGIRTAAALLLTFDTEGKLELQPESSLAVQQPALPACSNSTAELAGGYPAYEFGDGTGGTTGILRGSNGAPTLRLWSRSTAESPNRWSVEFQNEFNEYQQDSVSLLDADDWLATGQELSATVPALGLPNFDQAARVTRFQLQKGLEGNFFADFETSVQALGLRPGDIITLTYQKEGLSRSPFRIIRLAPGENYQTVQIRAQRHDDGWYSLLAGGSDLTNERNRRTSPWGALPRPLQPVRIGENGPEYDIEEIPITQGDGSTALQLKVRFNRPAAPSGESVSIPLIGLAPRIESSGGSLVGGRSYYYAVTAVTEDGAESELSFIVRATIPVGTSTNQVTLTELSFAPGTSKMRVYRGATPYQLSKIAEQALPAAQFLDTGLADSLEPPPDVNYDHANFYWRLESMPATAATIASADTIGNTQLAMSPNEFRGATVRIVSGTGTGQERDVLSNSATTLTITPQWTHTPDAGSTFVLAEGSWRRGGTTKSDEVQFEVINRPDTFLHVLGRSANALDGEAPVELSPLERYRVVGSAGEDGDVPPEPVFSLTTTGAGQLWLLGIGFPTLENTRTIAAGTLVLHYWNELAGPSGVQTSGSITAQDEWLALAPAMQLEPATVVQIGSELLRVVDWNQASGLLQVQRGVLGSAAAAHGPGERAYILDRRVTVAPFVKDFFGSPASGSYALGIPLRSARVTAAEFLVTNARGDSPTATVCFTSFQEHGLRTLSGGQYTIQREGDLAIETSVAPPLIVDEEHSVGSILATLSEAPVGAPVVLRLRVDGQTYCDVTVPAGSRNSALIGGADMPPLMEGEELTLDVLSVGQGTGTRPGRDLTVTIRL
jgi:hypothetical protein